MKIALLSFRSIIFNYSVLFILVSQIRYFTYCADQPGDSDGAVGGAIGGNGDTLPKQKSMQNVHVLDISDTNMNEKYFHYKEGNYETFCRKTVNSFNKIIKTKNFGRKVIWEAENNKNCEFVRIYRSENKYKYMLIILTGGEFVLLLKPAMYKTWKNITHTRQNFSMFQFLFFDGGNFKEFKPNRDLMSVVKFSVGYKFKDGINCHKIIVGDKLVYDYEFIPDFGLLKEIYLDLLTDEITVVSHIDKSMKINMEEARSLPTPVPVHHTDLPSELKLIGYEPVDPFDPFNPDNFSEIFHTKYSVKRVGPDYEYDLRNSKCVTIKCGDKTIWNKPHDSDMYPLSMKILKVEKRIIVRFSENFVNLKLVDGDWKSESFPYEKSELSKEIDDTSSIVPITEEQLKALSKCEKIDIHLKKCEGKFKFDCSIDKETGNGMFIARDGFVFNSIVSGEEKIWEADEGEYCKKIMVQCFNNKICKHVTIFNVNGSMKHYKKIKKHWKMGGNGLIFYIQEEYSDYTYDCRYEGEMAIFTVKLNYKFFMVKDKEEMIWQSRNRNERGMKIITNNRPSYERTNLSVYLYNGTINHFEKIKDIWKQTSNIKLLDISMKKNSFHFTCLVEGSCKSYLCNQDFKINKVVKKDLDIWISQPNDHANKVVIKGSGSSPKYLGILLDSGSLVLLHKSGKNQPWNDITNLSYDLRDLKLLKSDNTEIERGDYEVDLSNTTFSYIFKENVKITSIKYNNREVWSYGSGSGVECPLRLNLELIKNQLSLTFDLGIERKFYVT